MVAWSEIDTVMFDMDGSLLDLHFDNFFWLKLVPEHFSKQPDSQQPSLPVAEFPQVEDFGLIAPDEY